MSHFARIVEQLEAWTVATNERVVVSVDTEIKKVRVVDGGFQFEARMIFQTPALREAGHSGVSGWLVLGTPEDLPAFTDKGRAHRARQKHATLAPGRPLEGDEPTVKPVAFRPTAAQRAWVEHQAARKELTVSEYVREALHAKGMPR